MPPPGKNANGRSLGGRKQIQSSPQSHTNIYFAQARRELEMHWRARATQVELQLLILLAQSIARCERRLTGEATGNTLSVITNALELMRRLDNLSAPNQQGKLNASLPRKIHSRR
jgi:hypothetical protein